MEVKGYLGGVIKFDGRMVVIQRKGLSRLTIGKGEKRIPVRSISSVQLKPAGFAVNGYIQFSLAGGNEVRSQFGRATMDATADENSVVFTKKQQPEFEALRDAIEDAILTQN